MEPEEVAAKEARRIANKAAHAAAQKAKEAQRLADRAAFFRVVKQWTLAGMTAEQIAAQVKRTPQDVKKAQWHNRRADRTPLAGKVAA